MLAEGMIIPTPDGEELYGEMRENGSPVTIIVTHGINEHLRRLHFLVDLFSPQFNIFFYDLRGHGKSSGKRGYIKNFSQFPEDLDHVLSFLKQKFNLQRYILFGHSMGALITAYYVQQYAKKDFYPERVFLSSPPIGVGGPLGKVMKWSPLSVFDTLLKLPSLKLSKMVDLNYLSHNPKVAHEFLNDDLTLKSTHTRLLIEMAKASREVFSRPLRSTVPTYCAIGSEDKIVSPEECRYYFENIDKSVHLKIIPGAYHELHNEIEKYRDLYFDFLRECLNKSIYAQEV
jgi:acylglycerol lipase